MNLASMLPLACFCLAALVRAQVPPSTGQKPKPELPWRQQKVIFSGLQPILGVPAATGRFIVHCSEDGSTYINQPLVPGKEEVPDLYRIVPSGEATPIRRLLPLDYTGLLVRDFFAADDTLVTLLEGVPRDEHEDPNKPPPPRDPTYFFSLSDRDGSSPKLLKLDLKFKPLRVALFGTGDFLVLGWDETNDLPLLALVKEDGTVRRFLDFDETRHEAPYTTYGSIKEAEAAPKEISFASLQRAVFVPYGQEVLLTYPGTARSVRVLSALGEDRSIPIALPAGFILHDVLVSGPGYPLVLRAEPRPIDLPIERKRRLFEMNSHNGQLLREFLFDAPRTEQVTCASTTTLSAIFLDTIASRDPPKDGADARQLVIATAHR